VLVVRDYQILPPDNACNIMRFKVYLDIKEPLVPLFQEQSTIKMKDKMNGRGQDMLSTHDRDVLFLSVPALKEMLAVLEFVNRSRGRALPLQPHSKPLLYKNRYR
jgi:hypothetical protein